MTLVYVERPVAVADVDPLVDPRWSRLVYQYPSSVFHSPAWLNVLARTYGFEVRALIVLDAAGEPTAGLPLCRVRDLRGERIVALPFSDYCDPLVGSREHWEMLADHLIDAGCPVLVRPLHNDIPLADARFEVTKRARWHGIDLGDDLAGQLARLHGSARRGVQKAQRDGVTVRIADHPDDLRTFFDLHRSVRKHKYRLLAQPFQFFEQIWTEFIADGNGRLLLASREDQVLGGALFLEWRDTLYYKFSASAANTLGHRQTELLLWEGIKYGTSRGLAALDLGLSDWDQEGLILYKRKFATEEKTISFLQYRPREAAAPANAQLSEVLGKLTDLLTDPSVPDRVTDEAGELLYRFFA
jgi:CelD/BcsL family acetyltransferase involved in cellulose biosynthesis